MNRIYRSIWNDITGTFVAVAETAKAGGKSVSSQMGSSKDRCFKLQPLALALMAVGIAHAAPPANTQLPTNGNVVAGQVDISQNNAVMTVTQGSNRAVVDWGSFNIGSSAAVNFVQPSASSAILNRVMDANPSQILGRINANGQVFLTNASGIYFGTSANINVGALTATTHSIGNDDFMASRLTFQRNGSTSSVVNEGQIIAGLGGYIALLAPEVRNTGVVVAQMGTVALTAGETFELQFDGSRLANVRVEPATVAALVDNGQAVLAPGGLIIMSAQAANRLQGGVVNNTGRLEANGLVDNGGTIRLMASDSIQHSGSISANAALGSSGKGGNVTLIANLDNASSTASINGSISARGGDAGGDGGFVETSGGRVKIGIHSRVDTRAPKGKTGMWLLDPLDYTIAATGGDETGASVGASLATSDRTIAAVDNIHVNDNVTWSANKLTFQTANGDVNINAVMTANNTASLDLEPGSGNVNVGINADGSFKGRVDFFQADGTTPRSGTGFLTISNVPYTVITTLGAEGSVTGTDLQGMSNNLSGHFALGSNIDASATSGWGLGVGFTPIGSLGSSFTGVLDGLGHSVNGLRIHVTNPSCNVCDYIGLIGNGSGATIRNIGVSNADVEGWFYVGGLVGGVDFNTGVQISNSYSTGAIVGNLKVGGLVGANYGGSIQNSYSKATVRGANYAGGLVGQSFSAVSNSYATGTVTVTGGSYAGGLIGSTDGGTISNSYATGTVIGNHLVGGLTGRGGGSITNSYATGTVTGGSEVGGLVGYNNYGSISNSYATGAVTGADNVGGLVGYNNNGSISNSYATGAIIGANFVGGLVGFNNYGSISNSYATGAVTGNINDVNVGGLVGYNNYGSISNSYATGAVTGGSEVGGLVGYNYGISSISNSYATGAVSGNSYVGGLVGVNNGNISNSYATGAVTGVGATVGALVGQNGGLVNNSFYNKSVNSSLIGIGNSIQDVAGTVWGMSSADMKDQSNFTSATPANSQQNPAWDFTPSTGKWAIARGSNNGYPCLVGLFCAANTSTPIYLRLISGSSIYGDTPVLGYKLYDASSGGSQITDASASGSVVWSTPLSATSNANTYSETYVSGISLGNSAYTLNAGSAVNWTINPRPLTITSRNVTRNYGDPNVPSSWYLLPLNGTDGSGSGLANGDRIYIFYSLSNSATSTANAGTTHAITPINQSFTNGTAANYAITYIAGTLSITQRPITVTAVDQSRTYGSANPTSGSVTLTSGSMANTDTLGTASVSSTATSTTAAGQTAPLTPSGQTFSTGTAGNYAITYADGTLSITPVIVVPVLPAAVVPVAESSPSPLIAPTMSIAQPNNDGVVTVSLMRESSVQSSGLIAVSVPKAITTTGSGFSFPLPAQVVETAVNENSIQVTTATGQALPGWLNFNSQTKSFTVSAVPDGAFPIQVVVIVNGTRTTVMISERNEN